MRTSQNNKSNIQKNDFWWQNHCCRMYLEIETGYKIWLSLTVRQEPWVSCLCWVTSSPAPCPRSFRRKTWYSCLFLLKGCGHLANTFEIRSYVDCLTLYSRKRWWPRMEEGGGREGRMTSAYFQSECFGIYQYKSHEYKWSIAVGTITIFSEKKPFSFAFSEMPVRLNRQTNLLYQEKTELMYFSVAFCSPSKCLWWKAEGDKDHASTPCDQETFVSPDPALAFTQQA